MFECRFYDRSLLVADDVRSSLWRVPLSGATTFRVLWEAILRIDAIAARVRGEMQRAQFVQSYYIN